jgi:hypothetical protein
MRVKNAPLIVAASTAFRYQANSAVRFVSIRGPRRLVEHHRTRGGYGDAKEQFLGSKHMPDTSRSYLKRTV